MTPRPLLAAAAAAVLWCCSSDDQPATPAGGADGGTEGGDAAPSAKTGDHASGDRLRARLLAAEGATDVGLFLGWRDTKLDVDCAFDLGEDDALRCVPVTVDLYGATFLDDGCKQPVERGEVGDTDPRFAVRRDGTKCGAGAVVYRLGAGVEKPVVYEKSVDGNCSQITPTGYKVYPLLDKLEAAELVAATSTRTPIADGLGVVRLEAEDGASEAHEIYDVRRDATCARGGGTKDDRCVPTALAFEEGLYSDSCVTRAAYRSRVAGPCGRPPAAILREGRPDACGVYEASLVEVGAEVTTRPLFRRTLAACEDAKIPASGDGSYWTFGAPLPLTTLPAMTALDEGGGRIKLRADAAEGGARLIGRTLFDGERNVACRPTRAADGVERCLPVSNASTQGDSYADAACEKPFARAAPTCTPRPLLIQTTGIASETPPRVHVFATGAKVTPATVYRRNGSDCVESTPAAGDALYETSEVPATSFVALAKKTE